MPLGIPPAGGRYGSSAAARGTIAIVAVQLLLCLVHLFTGDNVWRALTFGSVSAITLVLLGISAISNTADHLSVWCVTGGAALWFCGGVTWDVLSYGFGEDPFPSIADLFYLSGYGLMAIGIWLRWRRRRSNDLLSVLEAASIATAMGSVVWALLAVPTLREADLTLLERSVSIAYPVSDIILVGMVAGLLIGSSVKPDRREVLFGLAILSFVASDIAFAVVGTIAQTVPTWVDLGWLLCYVLLGASTRIDSTRIDSTRIESDGEHSDDEGQVGRMRIGSLMVAALGPGIVIPVQLALGVEPDLLSTALFIVVGVALLAARLDLSLRRVAHRAAEERRERKVMARLAAASNRAMVLEVLGSAVLELDDVITGVTIHELRSETSEVLLGAWPANADLPVPSLGQGMANQPTYLDSTGRNAALSVINDPSRCVVMTLSGTSPLAGVIQNAQDKVVKARLALNAMDALENRATLHAARRYEAMIQHSADGILILDPLTEQILYASPAAGRLLLLKPAELVGRAFEELVVAEHRPGVAALRRSLGHAPAGATVHSELDLQVDETGPRFRAELSACNLSEDIAVGGWTITFSDVTVQRRLELQLRHQAFHDSLTGLPNRALFHDRLTHALRRPDYEDSTLTILYIDLDGFKNINDALGHPIGDQLLQLVASRLRAVLRSSDTAARLGGDEFAVLLEGVQHAEIPERMAGKILETLRFPFTIDDHELYLSASIGVVSHRTNSLSANVDGLADELRQRADLAMYDAKHGGKNRFAIYHDGLQDQARRRLDLGVMLQHAVAKGEIHLDYQPLVEMATGRTTGVEALARWHHPQHGLIPPDQFIPVAEDTGLIIELGAQLLDRACREIGDWRRTDPDAADVVLNINVSVRQLQDASFVPMVVRTLERNQFPATALTIEITESMLMTNASAVIERLHQVRDLGIGVAVDDFGTGYSSLSQLAQLPVTELKIDRLFVNQLNGANDTGFVRAIIEMARALDLNPIAEGVENPVQAHQLAELGCSRAQGFHFARPTHPSNLSNLLAPP